jgi:hypothetical protein
LTIGGIIAVLAIAVENADPFIVRIFWSKIYLWYYSKLLQIHQETLWRRPKNISNVALHHYQEGYHESKMLPVLDCCDYAGHLSIVTLKLR